MTADITSTHTYTGNHTGQLAAFLAGAPHHWDVDGDLVLTTPDGEIHARPGWLLVRWTDRTITTATPHLAERTYGPEGLAGRLDQTQDAVARVREAAAQLMRAALNTDGEPLTPRDQGIDTAVRRLLAALDQPPGSAS
ncbi:hypothetical protein F9278_36290 [Streptomyces phaeolivaceus]|uniref:Uncharacterized protein n=1 Tax=Streptomyces phaeolivaceus TaxID=2653200 RepID=A0A5P8KCK4_9ACTN|nr:hypothetical protein [Streptomyces phaeolivaceus]QFR00737.1 hypothetical protein F9278_36290 [Streptomyces phaeolivaceus]